MVTTVALGIVIGCIFKVGVIALATFVAIIGSAVASIQEGASSIEALMLCVGLSFVLQFGYLIGSTLIYSTTLKGTMAIGRVPVS